MDAESLGETLRGLRESRGLSLAALARRAGVGKASLHHWENGRFRPTGPSLARALDALEADPRLRARLLTALDVRFARIELAHTPMGPPVDVGAVVRLMRARRGMTQADLARTAGVAQGTVAKWESGASTPSAATVHALAFALGASAAEAMALASVQGGGEAAFGWKDPEHALRSIREEIVVPESLARIVTTAQEAEAWRRASRDARWDPVLCDVMSRRSIVQYSLGNVVEAEATARRTVRFATRGETRLQAMASFDVLSLGSMRRRDDPAEFAEVAANWAESLSAPEYKAWALTSLARRQAMLGRGRSAMETLRRVSEQSELAGDERDWWEDLNAQTAVHLASGHPRRAMALLDQDPGVPARMYLYIQIYHANGLAAPEAWIEGFRRVTVPIGSGWIERERIARVERRQERLLRRS